MRALNRIVLMGCALFVPLYLVLRLTGGSLERMERLPELYARLKHPIVCEVPEGGVRYENFFHGPADEGYKFVLVRVRMEARLKIGYPIVPRCFRLVDEQNTRYYPLSRAPLFIARGDEFYLDEGDAFEGELLFEVPRERRALNLLFDRYQE